MQNLDDVKVSPWHSLRVKITAATVCALILAMLVAMALGVAAIRNIGNKSAEQTLLLLCEAGQKTWTRILKAWSSLSKSELWEQVDVARGLAVYDPKEDESVNDVVRRADKLMYDHKWNRKRNVT